MFGNKIIDSLRIGFARVRQLTIDGPLKIAVAGSGTQASPHRTCTGRVRIVNSTGSSQSTIVQEVYNTNVTKDSVILLQLERDSGSGAFGNNYIVNLSYNTSPAGRYLTPGQKFRVDMQLRGGTLIPNGNGVTLNYIIIN